MRSAIIWRAAYAVLLANAVFTGAATTGEQAPDRAKQATARKPGASLCAAGAPACRSLQVAQVIWGDDLLASAFRRQVSVAS